MRHPRAASLSNLWRTAFAALVASFALFAGGFACAAAGAPQHVESTEDGSAPVLYNRANAYSRQGDVGHAILNYERAQILAPRDADIAHNLALTRERAGLTSVRMPAHEVFARLLSVADWCAVAIAGVWFACGAVWLARSRRSRWIGRIAACAALVSVAVFGALGIRAAERDVAVVTASGGAPVQLSPFAGAESVSNLAAGQEVSTFARHGDFVRVDDGRGHAGWVVSSAVELVVPRKG